MTGVNGDQGSSPAAAALLELLAVMARLRDPVGGCPWDLVQDFGTIAPYTIEEAYEVAAAIHARVGEPGDPDWPALLDELGDLLLQVAYHAQLAAERGRFGFAEVAAAITAKMLRRHPHVFGPAAAPALSGAAWEEAKALERRQRSETGVLAGVPTALPALIRAAKLTKRAARVGFDWPGPGEVLDKLEEEAGELRAELGASVDRARAADEVGDLLFVLANLARKLELDPEQCLRAANAKFERRFEAVEQALAASGRTPSDASLPEMETLWQEVKARERSGSGRP